MRRRAFLAVGLGMALAHPSAWGVDRVRDRQGGLDSATPARVLRPRNRDDVGAAIREAKSAGVAICAAGRRHSSGGQALLDGGWMLDMTALDGVRSLDVERGLLELGAGAQWPAVMTAVRNAGPRWAIRQKQTIAALTLGGTVSANAHGNGAAMAPIGADIEWLEMVDAEGIARVCSRDVDPTRFRAALGGFGLVGVITAMALRLRPREAVRSLVDSVRVDELAARLSTTGARYTSAHLPVDSKSSDFLRRGLLLYDVPDVDGAVEIAPSAVPAAAWVDHMALLHRAPGQAWARMCDAWLAAAGRTWWADDLLMQSGYVEDYHRQIGPGCDVMVECLVPPTALAKFVAQLRSRAGEGPLQLLLCEIRHVAADVDSLLAYAPEERIAVVIAVHLPPQNAARIRVRKTLGNVVDDAIALGGGFHPAFSWCATPQRLARAFPTLPGFIAARARLDPQKRFRSQWHDRLMA